LAFEQEPAGLLQDRVKPFLFHAARLVSADIVESLVHLRHDVESVEDMEGIGALLADNLQIGLPHVEQTKTIFEATSSPMVVKNP